MSTISPKRLKKKKKNFSPRVQLFSSKSKIFLAWLLVLLSSSACALFWFSISTPDVVIFSTRIFSYPLCQKLLISCAIFFTFIWLSISYLSTKFSQDKIVNIIIKNSFSYLPCLFLLVDVFYRSHLTNLPNPIYSFFFFVLIMSSICVLTVFFTRIKSISVSPIFVVSCLSGLIILYIGTFTLTSFARVTKFIAGLCDLGMFVHVMWNTISGHILHFQVFGHGYNFLGEHMSPILLLLTPFYWLFSSPKTLLFLQTVIIATGAIPVYLLAQEVLKNRFTSLVFSLAYLFYPCVARVNLFDFHEICFVIPLIIWVFYFLQIENYKLYYLFLGLSLLVKEEVSLGIFMIGIYALFIKKKKVVGLITLFTALIWAFLCIKVLIPYFRGEDYVFFTQRYGHLGNSTFGIIQYGIFHPFAILKQIFGQAQIISLFLLLVPLGLLPLLSIEVLLSLPLLLLHFLSSWGVQNALEWQYSAPIIPFFIVSGIYGLKNLIIIKTLINGKINSLIFPCHQVVRKFLSRLDKEKLLGMSTVFLLSTAILGNYFFSPPPFLKTAQDEISYNLQHHMRLLCFSLNKEDYLPSFHRQIYSLVKHLIPQGTSLSVQDSLAPELSNRYHLYQFPSWSPDIDYFFLDTSTHYKWTGRFGEAYKNIMRRLLNSSNYQLLFFGDGFYLFCKKDTFKEDILLTYKKLLKRKDTFLNHLILGSVYLCLDREKEAEDELKRAEGINPQLWSKYLNELVIFYLEENKAKKGIRIYEMSKRLSPKYESNNPHLYYLLGKNYEEMGQDDKGIDFYKRAEKYLRQGDKKEIIDLHMRLANLYYKKGLLDETINQCERILKVDPNNIEVCNNLGSLYYKKGLFNEAYIKFRHVLTIEPNHTYARELLGLISPKIRRH